MVLYAPTVIVETLRDALAIAKRYAQGKPSAEIGSEAEIRFGIPLEGGPTMDAHPIFLRADLAAILSEQDAQFLVHLFQTFHVHKSSQRYAPTHLRRVIGACQSFCAFSKKAPWETTSEDFSGWIRYLDVEKRLDVRSQRVCRSHIRCFYDFLQGQSVKCVTGASKLLVPGDAEKLGQPQ